MWLANLAAPAVLATLASASPVEHREDLSKRQTILPFTEYDGPLAYSPPKYPSPWARGSGNWSAAYGKAQAFVSQLTLAEKVNLTTGTGWATEHCVGNVGAIPRLGFPSLCMQDAPLGVRFADYVSAFPAGINVAATWDRSLAYARGVAMGEEHRDKGVDVQLGPVCGPLGRTPTGGRNWEGFAPDPYLTGALIAPTIEGIQSAGVVACTKHFIMNEQERFRQAPEAQGYGFNITESISTNPDDKTMHELYLWPFADAVRAGTGSIMCSYNQINNSYGCGNSYTQNYLLKNELDFQGFIMSDWQAQHSGVSDVLAGLDMTMPGDTSFDTGDSFWGTNLTIAVLNGTVPQYRLDDMVIRIMAAYYYVGRDTIHVPTNFDSWSRDTYGPLHSVAGPDYGVGLINQHVDVRGEHAAVIRAVAQASTVLLKNKGALPLSGTEKWTAIIGEDAGSNAYGPNGCSDHGCDNGTLAMGWGSGTSDFPYLVTPEQAIQNYILTTGKGEVFAITDNYAESQIVTLAKQASVSLVFINSDSGEGYISVDGNEGDRKNLTAWHDGDRLIQNVTSVCNNTVVVIHSVGAIDVSAWYDNENVTAIVWAGLPGQESGNALVDVLYGKVNPGGKLPFTMAAADQYNTQILSEPNNGQFGAPQEDLPEGQLIDYRAFDALGLTPIYEFGFGLSYTTFSYSGLVITPVQASPYVATDGETTAAPTYGTVDTNPASYVYPADLERVPVYIYPYINSTDLAASSGEEDYGLPIDQYIPAGAADSNPQPYLPAGGAPGGNPGLWETVATVSATIENTGSVQGDEVVQVYVALGDGEPPKVLRGFERLTIAAGQTATFSVELTRRDVSIWDVASQNWVQVESPTIFVGASSRNLPLSGVLSAGPGYSAPPTSSQAAPPSSQSAPPPSSQPAPAPSSQPVSPPPPPPASSQPAPPPPPPPPSTVAPMPTPASSSAVVPPAPVSATISASSSEHSSWGSWGSWGYGSGTATWHGWPATETP